jgi:hypothetical protein
MTAFNKNRVFIVLLVLLNLSSCGKPTKHDPLKIKFKKIEIDVIDSANAKTTSGAKTYINLTNIRRTVIYQNRIICVSSGGGLGCINAFDFKPDTGFQAALNKRFINDISVIEGNLYGTNGDHFLLWEKSGWVLYKAPLPINYFSVLYEDKICIFYQVCTGEFGSLLFIFNKVTDTTKGLYTSCTDAIIKTDSGYIVGQHLYHLGSGSSLYYLKSINNLVTVPDSLRFLHSRFDMDSTLIKLWRPVKKSLLKNIMPINFYRLKEGIIAASFQLNGNLYHVIDKNRGNYSDDTRYIGTIIKDSLTLVDSLKNCRPETTYKFGETTIINEDQNSTGFTMIRNDTIYKIRFKPNAF